MTFSPDVKDIVSWAVNLAADGAASATITLTNVANKYIPTELEWEQIEIFSTVNGVTRQWFHGVIIAAEQGLSTSSKQIVLRCQSLFGPLGKKPINTGEYTTENAQTLLTDMAIRYGCIDSSFVDFSTSDRSGDGTPIEWARVIISEANLIEAMRLIAYANMQELFVRSDGKLVAENYTTIGAGSFTIANEYVISAGQVTRNEEPYSKVRVRGGYISQIDAGPSNIYVSNVQLFVARRMRCVDVLITVPIRASNRVWYDATYSSTTPDVTVSLVNLHADFPDTLNLRFCKVGYFDAGTNAVNLTINGVQERDSQVSGLGVRLRPGPKPQKAELLDTLSKISRQAARRNQMVTRSQLSADEKEQNRIDVIATDNTLVGEFGTRWREIDNPYIPTTAVAALIALREFAEFKQSRKTWNLTTSYVPATLAQLDINKRVIFTPPEFGSTVDGVVRTMGISFSAERAHLGFTFSIEEFV